jgi:hypothetical protein
MAVDEINLKIFSPLLKGKVKVYRIGSGKVYMKQNGVVVINMPEAVLQTYIKAKD